MSKKCTGITAMILAAFCWGTMGTLTRLLTEHGLGSMDMVLVRCAFTAVLLFFGILFTSRERFAVRLRDLWIFVVSGLLTVLVFSYCYFSAVNAMSLSVASLLIYTSPLFVIPLAALLFRERITLRKILSLAGILLGMALITGLFGESTTVTLRGFFYGLGASFLGALIPVFNKVALSRGYTGPTITFYTYLVAFCGALLFCDVPAVFRVVFSDARPFLLSVGISVVNTIFPLLLINVALRYIEAGQASIIGMIDPVVTSLASVFLFREPMTVRIFAGIVLILGSIAVGNAGKPGDTGG